MTRHVPPRLRQQPELSVPFADLDEILDGYDLERIRPPPLPLVQLPRPRPGGAQKPGGRNLARLAAGGAGVGIGVFLIWWLWPSSPAPVGAPVQDLAPHPVEQVAPRPPTVPVAPAVVDPPRSTRRDGPPQTAPSVPAGTPAEQPDVAPEPPGVAPTTPNVLAEELRLFHLAEDALERGQTGTALEALDAYEQAFPAGRLRGETDLLRLQVRIAERAWAEAEALAARLELREDLAPRRPEIRAFRAGALAALGRCDEALALAAALPKKEAAELRKVCR